MSKPTAARKAAKAASAKRRQADRRRKGWDHPGDPWPCAVRPEAVRARVRMMLDALPIDIRMTADPPAAR